MQVPNNDDTPVETQYWYVRYHDSRGQWRKAKLSVGQIINRCQQGKFPKMVEVSPYANGDFRPLKAYAEFQDLAARQARAKLVKKEAAAERAGKKRSGKWSAFNLWIWLAVLLGVGIVGIVAVTLFMQTGSGQ